MVLATELALARAHTDSLFARINPEALYDRPIPERHRIIFYLGHLEAFDWNQMQMSGMTATSPQASFDKLFEAGIDPPPGQLPQDQPTDWPKISELRRYNGAVRETIDRNFSQVHPDVAHMMIEHRHMHAETFAYIMHNLGHEKKTGPAPQLMSVPEVVPAMIHIPAGDATLGRPTGDGFGWDNEYREFTVTVPEFSIGKYKVTNGEYLDFVKEGGAKPHYWLLRDGQWFYRGMFSDIPLPLDCPVYATLQQAQAFAKWRGASIPTEAQFQRASGGAWNKLSAAQSNFDYRLWDPVPVNAAAPDSHFGIAQTVGNGWEWTSTVFAPFEGFTASLTYPGYSANFFDGEHYVMKGASPRTAAKLVRPSFRNWFRPGYPYMYGTFRIVQN